MCTTYVCRSQAGVLDLKVAGYKEKQAIEKGIESYDSRIDIPSNQGNSRTNFPGTRMP